MELKFRIKDFLEHPVPLWENDLTHSLIEKKFHDLEIYNQFVTEYSLTKCILRDGSAKETSWPLFKDEEAMRIVLPSNQIDFFLEEHGLTLLPFEESNFPIITHKINAALGIFQSIPLVHSFISKIVKSIQILCSDNAETDISYSHPDIPFSIFFSLCEDKSDIADIRVAESILHEAMHLKLTLIEHIIPLVKPYSKEVYFSPWRSENRPIRGVLHGLFVFRAIYDFYILLQKKNPSGAVQQFLKKRIWQINKDMGVLLNFVESPGLTPDGTVLVASLLLNNSFYTTGSSGNLHLTQ